MSMLGMGTGGLQGLYPLLNLGFGIAGMFDQRRKEKQAAADNAAMLEAQRLSSIGMGDPYAQTLAGLRYNESTGQLEVMPGGGPANPAYQLAQTGADWQRRLGVMQGEARSGLETNQAADYTDLWNYGVGAQNRYGQYATDAQSRYGALAAAMQQQLAARRSEMMGALQGLGEQYKRDVDTRFTANEGNIRQDMVSRGLSGTTALGSMLTGNTREQTDAIGRVNETIGQQRLGVLNQLGGEETNWRYNLGAGGMDLANQLQLGQMDLKNQVENGLMNMRADNRDTLWQLNNDYAERGFGLDQQLGMAGLGMGQSAAQNWLNTIAGVGSSYPDSGVFSALMNNLGQGFAGDQQMVYQKRLLNRAEHRMNAGMITGGLLGGVNTGLGAGIGFGQIGAMNNLASAYRGV